MMIDEIKEDLIAWYIIGAHVAVLVFREIEHLWVWLFVIPNIIAVFVLTSGGDGSCRGMIDDE